MLFIKQMHFINLSKTCTRNSFLIVELHQKFKVKKSKMMRGFMQLIMNFLTQVLKPAFYALVHNSNLVELCLFCFSLKTIQYHQTLQTITFSVFDILIQTSCKSFSRHLANVLQKVQFIKTCARVETHSFVKHLILHVTFPTFLFWQDLVPNMFFKVS